MCSLKRVLRQAAGTLDKRLQTSELPNLIIRPQVVTRWQSNGATKMPLARRLSPWLSAASFGVLCLVHEAAGASTCELNG